jgi:hypothetical protein
MNISNDALATLLETSTHGLIFSCKFVKRTDNTIRTGTFRTGVQKGVKGVGLGFDPKAKRLLSVFDMSIQQFRFLNLNDLLEATIAGTHYIVV